MNLNCHCQGDADWWRDEQVLAIDNVDPITLEPLQLLSFPPFSLCASEPFTCINWWSPPLSLLQHKQLETTTLDEAKNTTPMGKMYQDRDVHLFDGRALACYMVSQLKFINPLNRRNFSRDEIEHLGRYLRENKFTAFNVAKAYDIKENRYGSSATMVQDLARSLLSSLNDDQCKNASSTGSLTHHPWWRDQQLVPEDIVDPITLEPIHLLMFLLMYPPFAVCVSAPYICINWWAIPVPLYLKELETEAQTKTTTNDDDDCSVTSTIPNDRDVHLFDGRAVACYMVSELKFVDPLNQRTVTRKEIIHLDKYLREMDFDAFDFMYVYLTIENGFTLNNADLIQGLARSMLPLPIDNALSNVHVDGTNPDSLHRWNILSTNPTRQQKSYAGVAASHLSGSRIVESNRSLIKTISAQRRSKPKNVSRRNDHAGNFVDDEFPSLVSNSVARTRTMAASRFTS